MSEWCSYPDIYNIGHKAICDIFKDEVNLEEKVDGSMIRFMKTKDGLKIRSKRQDLYLDNPDKMFARAIESIKTLDLKENWVYFGEYLSKPKHNALAYDRTPENHIILFDIKVGEEDYLIYGDKADEAARIGLEVVPLVYSGTIDSLDMFMELLNTKSILGGQKIEGLVAKNYFRFTHDKKVMMGKYVSEEFKEVHRKEWKTENPGRNDLVQLLITELKTDARWNKAIIHLKEDGLLENDPRDIGKLIKEIQEDIKKECTDYIKDKLYKHFISQILRGTTAGLPEWYKKKLAGESFE